MSVRKSHSLDFKWSQFRELIELHKFYFELIIKGAGFSFAIVGAVSSFVMSTEIRDSGKLLIALGVPILLSIGTFFFGIVGTAKTYDLSVRVKKAQIDLGITWRPHAEVLPLMMAGLGLLFLVVAVALVIVVANPELLPEPN